MKGERPTLVRDPHGPIHALFHQHMRGPDRLVNLVPLIRNREVLAEAPYRLEAEYAVPLCQERCRAGFSKYGGEM